MFDHPPLREGAGAGKRDVAGMRMAKNLKSSAFNVGKFFEKRDKMEAYAEAIL